MKPRPMTAKIQAEWPKEDKEALLREFEALNSAIEKASALADALAEKLKALEINVSCK